MNRRPPLARETVQYFEDVSRVFESFAHLSWSIFLDSGRPVSQHGRFDIITAFPKKTFVTYGDKTIIRTGSNHQIVPDDPFALIEQELGQDEEGFDDLPFTGGAVGFFSYDLGRHIERMPSISANDMQMPDMAVGIFHWAYIADHYEKKATVVGDLEEPRVRLNWQDIIENVSTPPDPESSEPFRAVSSIQSNMTESDYKEKFSKVKKYIASGDCYQVNLAQRFSAQVAGDSWDGYKQLRSINPSPFSAFINIPDCVVLSASPERFLQVRNHVVETKPIKGTRPRSSDKQKDEELKNELLNSLKDRAENVMIVDLLRNDLSKCCESNSVKVPSLFALESFPTVHHLVSTITGSLPRGMSPIRLLRACFPGGSITGAPKIRAMEIIEELEPHRRGLYCGSVGYIGFNGDMDTSIAIRTLVQIDQQVYFYAGGGLVWDSEVDAEYQETFDKAAALLKLLESK